eukprot:TRINITY_DN46943_c0_g1_i2.p1 TRINITY_DN46943_c0_g1~~TRINITY_DN46943_c0_g1_i2.p1  ORF type:complete len:1681 (-),score=360.26 TRINITY_DN46943_c0_g1_i2:146-5188(-)
MARSSTGTVTQQVWWTRRYFELAAEFLNYWDTSDAFREGRPVNGAFKLAAVDDVAVQGRDLVVHFSCVQQTGRWGRRRNLLCLRARDGAEAEEWADAIRKAVGSALKGQRATESRALPDDWDLAQMLSQTSSAAMLVAKVPLTQEAIEPIQNLVDWTFMCKSTRDRRGNDLPLKLNVLDVVGVQNAKCWTEYTTKRKSVSDSCHRQGHFGDAVEPEVLTSRLQDAWLHDVIAKHAPPLDAEANERWLFHGTSPQATSSITDSDFQIDLAGSHRGTMYGKGIYFAECSSKADEYAEPDENHVCRMLLCRVTLGRSLVNLEKSPHVEALVKRVKTGYDSVCGDRATAVNTFREFIVYDKNQVYPAFIVSYRRQDRASVFQDIRAASAEKPLDLATPGMKLIPYIVNLLEMGPNATVKFALQVFLDAAPQVVVPVLVRLLEDWPANHHLRQAAENCLKDLATRLTLDTPVEDNQPPPSSEHEEDQHSYKVIAAKWVPDLIRCLPSENQDARMAAVKAIGQLGRRGIDALEALIKCTEEPLEALQAAAIQAIGHLGTGAVPAMPALVARLKDNSTRVRLAAANALAGSFTRTAAMEHPEYNKGLTLLVPAFIECLEDTDSSIRQVATETFMRLDKCSGAMEAAVPHLVDCLRDDPSDGVRMAAAKSLSRLGCHSCPLTEHLTDYLAHIDMNARAGAAIVLGRLGRHSMLAVPFLLEAIAKDPAGAGYFVTASACLALSQIGECAVSTLHGLMEIISLPLPSPELADVRVHIGHCIGKLGIHGRLEPTVQTLIVLNSSDNASCRECARVALGYLGIYNLDLTLPVLIQAANNEVEERPRNAAIWAIGKMGTQKSTGLSSALPVLVRSARLKAFRLSSAKALGRLGKQAASSQEVFSTLLDCLADKHKTVRLNVQKALERIGRHNPKAVPLLVERFLASSNPASAAEGSPGLTPISAPEVAMPVDVTALWEVLGEDVRWEVLDDQDAARLEASFARDPNGCVQLEFASGETVEADFVMMTLLNVNTQAQSSLRRDGVSKMDDAKAGRTNSPSSVAARSKSSRKATAHDYRAAICWVLSRLVRSRSQAEQLRPLVKLLTGGEKVSSMYALAKLLALTGQYDEGTVLPALACRTGDGSALTRARVCMSLGHLGAKLVKSSKDKEAGSEKYPALLDEALGALIRELSEEPTENDEVRLAAAQAIGLFGSYAGPAVPALIERLRDNNKRLREAAIVSLAALGKAASAAVPDIAKRLKDKKYEVRKAAWGALMSFGSAVKPSVPMLKQFLEDPTPEPRAAAAAALGMIWRHAPEQIVSLRELLHDRDDEVRRYAIRAIAKHQETAVGDLPSLLEACRKDSSEKGRVAAAQAVGKIGQHAKEEATEGILKLLRKPYSKPFDGRVTDSKLRREISAREALVNALASFGPGGVADSLVLEFLASGSLLDPSPVVRAAMAAAVHQLATREALAESPDGHRVIAALTDCLRDKDEALLAKACDALADLCSTPWPARLLQDLLKDDREAVRVSAIEALVALGRRTVTCEPYSGARQRPSTSWPSPLKENGGFEKKETRRRKPFNSACSSGSSGAGSDIESEAASEAASEDSAAASDGTDPGRSVPGARPRGVKPKARARANSIDGGGANAAAKNVVPEDGWARCQSDPSAPESLLIRSASDCEEEEGFFARFWKGLQ